MTTEQKLNDGIEHLWSMSGVHWVHPSIDRFERHEIEVFRPTSMGIDALIDIDSDFTEINQFVINLSREVNCHISTRFYRAEKSECARILNDYKDGKYYVPPANGCPAWN